MGFLREICLLALLCLFSIKVSLFVVCSLAISSLKGAWVPSILFQSLTPLSLIIDHALNAPPPN